MTKHSLRKAAKNTIVGAATAYGGPVAGAIANYAFKKATGTSSSIVSPSKVIKSTVLGRYLDRRYMKKCGVEVKTHDVTASGVALTNTLTSGLGNIGAGIAQGLSAIDNRVGYGAEIKSLRVNIDFYAGGASTSASLCRVIIVHHKQMQNASLTGANILVDPTNIRSAYILPENQIRDFTIMKDRTFVLSSLTSGESLSFKKFIWNYKPKHCHELAFTAADTTGAIANMDKGAIYVMVMFQGATAPTFDYYYRLSYVDV